MNIKELCIYFHVSQFRAPTACFRDAEDVRDEGGEEMCRFLIYFGRLLFSLNVTGVCPITINDYDN